MEEKKRIRVSLSTVLFILALIVIIAMAYYIYVEKTIANSEIATLEANAGEMQNAIKDLQDKIDTISNTINSNTSEEINNSQSNNIVDNENNKFSEKEIKESITNYLNIFKGAGSVEGRLEKMGLLKYGEFNNNTLTTDNYRKTNIKYSDFKSTIMNYVSEEWFDNFNSIKDNPEFKEQDGLLYYFDGGWTGAEYEVESIRLKGDYSNLRYIAKAYCIYDEDSKELENIEFEVMNYNGKCVISYCD